MGDSQITSAEASLNFDTTAFYTNWIQVIPKPKLRLGKNGGNGSKAGSLVLLTAGVVGKTWQAFSDTQHHGCTQKGQPGRVVTDPQFNH